MWPGPLLCPQICKERGNDNLHTPFESVGMGIKSEEAILMKVLRVEITIVPCCRLSQPAFLEL
jgi:hypothetical protein